MDHKNKPTGPTKSNIANIAVLVVIFLAAIAVLVIAGNRAKARQLLQDQLKPMCTKGDYRLYFNQTHRCYKEGTQGPCGKLMVLNSVQGLDPDIGFYGECKCKTFGKPGCATRPTIYWKATNRCYFLFDQGPCRKGRWLIANKNNHSKCVTIPCPEEFSVHKHLSEKVSSLKDPDPKFVFSSYNKCNVTMTQGFCPDGEVVHFTSNSFRPQCTKEAQSCGFNYSAPTIVHTHELNTSYVTD